MNYNKSALALWGKKDTEGGRQTERQKHIDFWAKLGQSFIIRSNVPLHV